MSKLFNHFPKWLRFVLKGFATLILFGLVALFCFAFLAFVASAETMGLVDQKESVVHESPQNVTNSGSVLVTASVPIGNWCEHQDNWTSTLRLYNGNVEAMLASQGFTPESFKEYCLQQ